MHTERVRVTPVLRELDRREVLAFLREISRGRWRLHERRWDEAARTLVFAPSDVPRIASRRELQVLALVARGASNLEAGYILGVGDTTVSTYANDLARALDARPIDLVAFGPLLARLDARSGSMAHLASGERGPTLQREADHVVLTYPTPRAILRTTSTAELAIARWLADGLSNDAIAALRSAAPRTVANQIATLYRKLGARCRRECTLLLYGGQLASIELGTLAPLAALREP
jgi:DNA-binding NarL/FixJ family response regulator